MIKMIINMSGKKVKFNKFTYSASEYPPKDIKSIYTFKQ